MGAQNLDNEDHVIIHTLAALSPSVHTKVSVFGNTWARVSGFQYYSSSKKSLTKTAIHKIGQAWQALAGTEILIIVAIFLHMAWIMATVFNISSDMQDVTSGEGKAPSNGFKPCQQSQDGDHARRALASDASSCPPPAHIFGTEPPLLLNSMGLYTSNIDCILPALAHTHVS